MKKNKINMFVWWIFWLIYLEMIYRIFIVEAFKDYNTLSVILFTIPWAILFSVITSLFNSKINRVLNIILTLLVTLFTLAQIVYFNFYNSIFSFFSLTAGTGQVMQFWEMILKVIGSIWYVFLLILVPLLLVFIFRKKLFNYKRTKYSNVIVYLIIMNLFLIGIMFRVKYDKGLYTLEVLFHRTHAPMLTINKTGLLTMEATDLYRYIFGFDEKAVEDDSEDVVEEPVIEEKEVEYNKLDIDFDALANSTSNKSLKTIDNYFKTLQPTEKNEYTGMFKDKNLIFITGEAFDTLAIDKDLTPTLYMLANNSFVFKNYYHPLYTVSTLDGEYLNLTSLIPKEGVWSFYKSSKNKMSYTLGNMFKKNGYTTYAFHNHTYNYYSRDKSHPNAGFTYIGCRNGLEKKMNCKHWPNSDYEMMQVTPDYYIKADKFATYYLTVSGHLNYNFGGNNMAYRNKDAVSHLKYSTPIKAYMATQIELDKAMKELLDRLEREGRLDDTLIVLAPDHYPYGLKSERKEMSNILGYDRTDKFGNYHTSLIMYNPNIEKTVIDKVCGPNDLMPTIYNLFGLDYDSRVIMGRDIFSEQEHIVILSDRSWITDKGTYNSVNGKFKAFDGQEVESGYVDRINGIVKNRYTMSTLILDNDYYKHAGI